MRKTEHFKTHKKDHHSPCCGTTKSTTVTRFARYEVRVSARRCNAGMVPFTVAWRSSGASLPAVPSTIGSAP